MKQMNGLFASQNPLQFAYCPTRSTEDAILSTLHLALTHLEKKDMLYVKMDFRSAFNTTIPQQLPQGCVLSLLLLFLLMIVLHSTVLTASSG